MINLFKNRIKAEREAYLRGYHAGCKDTVRMKNKELITLRDNAREIISKKTIEVKQRDKRLSAIEERLGQFASLFARVRSQAIRIEQEQEVIRRQQAYEYQKVITMADEMMCMCREYEKIVPKIQEKIEKYKLENLS